MRLSRVWNRLLGVEAVVVEGVIFDVVADAFVVAVRPRARTRTRCGVCSAPAPGYDDGEGRRRWRGLDLGSVRVFVEAEAPRVNCAEHGVTVAAVSWARHRSRFLASVEDQVVWLAKNTSKAAVTQLMRIAWRTVGAIITRVVAEAHDRADPLDGLRRIAIDEISVRKGHRYMTVVSCHDTGRLVWMAPGRSKATLRGFFDALGRSRSWKLVLVTADGASWIADVVRARCMNARLALDPFHVVKWATDALDEVRREVWNTARHAGATAMAKELKGSRFALWKNPERLTGRQQAKLAWVATLNGPLYRAWLLKEELRQVFALKGEEGIALIAHWLTWAARCRIPAFVKLACSIRTTYLTALHDALRLNASNAIAESTNTKLRVLMRVAFGYRDTEALIAMAMLARGGVCPVLPGRAAA